jgi:hypothetical protein
LDGFLRSSRSPGGCRQALERRWLYCNRTRGNQRSAPERACRRQTLRLDVSRPGGRSKGIMKIRDGAVHSCLEVASMISDQAHGVQGTGLFGKRGQDLSALTLRFPQLDAFQEIDCFLEQRSDISNRLAGWRARASPPDSLLHSLLLFWSPPVKVGISKPPLSILFPPFRDMVHFGLI